MDYDNLLLQEIGEHSTINSYEANSKSLSFHINQIVT